MTLTCITDEFLSKKDIYTIFVADFESLKIVLTLFFLIEPLALKLKAFSGVEMEPYHDLHEVEEG